MDKLSLYEILSYLVPGFIASQLINFYYVNVFNQNSLINEESSNLETSFILFIIALFLGIFTHIITFRLINFKWIKKLIYRSPQQISSSNDFVKRVIPFLNDEYKKLRKHKENELTTNEADVNLFDFAYFYLEVNDKVTPAKNFQSLYFAFRNMFTLSLLTILITIITLISGVFINFEDSIYKDLKQLLFITLLVMPIIIICANWLREKLVEKIFWSYYIERVHQTNESN